jgi:two-component system sensor histidine kinase MtrB
VGAFNDLADQLWVHEQARREFASDVSHELHSLASAMQTAAEALERGASEANPALGQRLIGGLVGHTRRLSRLADDLLELARWEGGRLRVDAQDMDPPSWCAAHSTSGRPKRAARDQLAGALAVGHC